MPRQFNCYLTGWHAMSDGGARPFVSVVIPCHDQAPFVADAALSAVARAARVEVIVVDDGSTDQTAAVARGLHDVLLIRQSHRGLAAARNRGLLAAMGEFIVFLDASDRLLPGAIDAGVRALTAHPACAMAYGRCVLMGADGRLWPAPEVPSVRSGHHAALLQTNLIQTPAMAMFRRGAVAAIGGFREGFDGAADYDLYLRLSRDGAIHDHGLPVAAYRRDARASSGPAERMLRDTLAVMLENRPENWSELHGVWREGRRRWQDVYGMQIVEEIRGHVRERTLAGAWRKSLLLARLAPRVFVRELARAVRVRDGGRAVTAAADRAFQR